MWAATNQCLGGSASCVNIAERLNRQLRQCKCNEIQTINSAAFSIAMNGTEAQLYVSWKHDENYYTQKVDSFLLQSLHPPNRACTYTVVCVPCSLAQSYDVTRPQNRFAA